MADEKEQPKQPKIKQFFGKFKKIKGIEIAIVVILLAVMLLIAFSSFKSSSKKTSTVESVESSTSLETYCANLEKKLNGVLSQINGAGNVSSMITLAGGFEQKLVYTKEESQTTGEKSGTTTSNIESTQSVVYVVKDGVSTPLVAYIENPKIAGVVVVSSGASNVNVKLDIIRAVSTLLNVDVSCIEVLTGK